MRLAPLLWLTFVTLVGASGYLLFHACALALPDSNGWSFCLMVDADLRRDDENAAALQAEIHRLKLELANRQAQCFAELRPPQTVILKQTLTTEPERVTKPLPKTEPRPQRQQPASSNTSPRPKEGNSQSAPQAAAGLRTVSASELGYLVPPAPIYPARSRASGEQGTVTVRALVDAAGHPTQVILQTSSGHPALDEAAITAVRAARFRPYSDGGASQAVWVVIPINFVLR